MSPDRISDFIASNPILVAGFVGVTLALVFTEIGRLRRKYRIIGPAAVTELINREQALAVDLRPVNEFEKGHIAGSRNIPLGQFEPDHKVLAKAREVPVVLICARGLVAGTAADRLAKAGFGQVNVLEGGIAGWQQAELPLARGR